MARHRKFFPKRVIVQMIVAPVLIVLCALVYLFGVHSTISDVVLFDVSRGDTVSGVAQKLERDGIIDSAYVFKMSVRLNGGKIQSGQYEIPAAASAWRIAHMFATGDVAATTIVIPEGLTIRQIKNLLLQSSALTGAVECQSGNNAPVCNLKDGQIFPDTYRVARGTSRLALLDLARKKMQNLEDAWRKTNRKLPKPLKNWDEVVILASIVQKETPQAREMPIVASVYLNRLNKGMRLQADPTVVYALTDKLGDMQGQPLLRGHLKIESPYNTYRNAGLPPAPIANVGENAIRAVLKPADTNYLFFVADGRGGHLFSKDYEEHKKNHNDWREIKKLKNKN
ncbi:MAG: endolytic transglycosylase MltG [Alphaproteobacteria bacterium]|nr:endolytic transglycosylase MltG [Alphaproteobacteria bacterium]